MARPKKDPEKLLKHNVKFRITDKDYLAALKKCDDKISLAEYGRQKFLHGNVVINQTRSLDHAAFNELRRVGVNLNQLTKLTHKIGEMPGQLPVILSQIENILADIMNGSENFSREKL